MKEFVNMWKNYFNFKDRTTRRGYWMAVLINVIVAIILGIIGGLADTIVISVLYSVAILIPALAMLIRRFRDAGKSWVNIFWYFLPVIGWIIMLVFLCKPSVEDDGTPVV